MSILQRAELEASPLADLHALAGQMAIDGFRRLRREDLIDALLGEKPADDDDEEVKAEEAEEEPKPKPKPRARRSRKAAAPPAEEEEEAKEAKEAKEADEDDDAPTPRASTRTRRARGGRRSAGESSEEPAGERTAEGVVELLGNGSAFLRVDPPEPSDDDVYVSAAQVRRCELVSGDRVTGPVRSPRRSERYPSLVRIDTINGASAEAVAEGTHYDELPCDFPSERLALGGEDLTVKAIEWLTPIGRGSRVTIVGPARSGKSEAVRRLAAALSDQEELELSLLLVGVRPEELAGWREGPVTPVAALALAASAEAHGQAVDRAVETAKRVAARGGHAVVLIDTLDALHVGSARRALAAARSLVGGGSLTVIGTANAPLGGESTVIALDLALTSTGRLPALDLAASGTLRPELLVGEAGAEAIAQARAAALE
ncbi:MAG TPA: Rho termination factor N-terminal domain-containing protein [Solirubrobacteraceae bacterium]|jgi:transcription termination factor Rho|nr:Rho termination factor N-terminal domain-containing protein [Solirubrobacteraceae bacterium]